MTRNSCIVYIIYVNLEVKKLRCFDAMIRLFWLFTNRSTRDLVLSP